MAKRWMQFVRSQDLGAFLHFLQTAARERLARLRLLGLLDELDAKHGAPTAKAKKAIAADAARVFRRRAR